MLRKASNATLAASISSATVSPSVAVATTPIIVTYTTVDPHNLYVGARVTITGLTSTDANSPNVTRVLVYKLDGPNTFSVILPTTTVYATAPTISLTGGAGVYGTMTSVNPSLSASKVRYSQPVSVDRPAFYNYIYPTITATPTGTGIALAWEAIGVASPSVVTYSLERITGTDSSVVLSSLNKGTYLDENVATIGSATTFTYRISATNTISTNLKTAKAVSLYIADISTVTTTPVSGVENAITISWSAPTTNAVITSYELQRLDITTTSPVPSWSSLVPESGPIPPSQTSYTDLTALDGINYTYRVRAVAFYPTGGSVVSNYKTSSYVAAYYMNNPASITASATASTANSITVSWPSVTANPAVYQYELQESFTSGVVFAPYSAFTTVQATTSTSFVQTNALSSPALAKYRYRVRAKSSELIGDWVEISGAGAEAYYINASGAPIVAKAVNSTTNTSIIVSGTYLGNPSITGYNIRRSSDNGANWTNIGATNFSITLPYTDTTAVIGTEYVYSVKAQSSQLTTANWSTNSAPIKSNSQQLATGGDTIVSYVEDGTLYFAHTFTNSGTFTPVQTLSVEYLIVGGGGGGGGGVSAVGGGGGGAGGMQSGVVNNVTATAYSIVVGNGGAGVANGASSNGQPSSFAGVTSLGGGRGSTTNGSAAAAGGSGGGAGNGTTNAPGAGTAGQGFAGGSGSGVYTQTNCGGGGGGGKGGVGGNASGSGPAYGGAGGAGAVNKYATGVNQTYAVGGGGGGPASGLGATSTALGSGGGGSAGAGGSTPTTGSNGIKGVVVIRYASA